MSVKKFLASAALILCGIIAFSCAGTALSQPGITDTGVRVRDPFVLEHKGVVYMFGFLHIVILAGIAYQKSAGIKWAVPDNELHLTACDLPYGMNCSFGT